MSGNPDTALIFLQSSYDTAMGGSVFLVDQLAFSGVTGIKSYVNDLLKGTVYPNPATDNVNFTTSFLSYSTVTVYDVIGKIVATEEMVNGKSSLNTENFVPGIYSYRICDKEGNNISSGKFNIVK